MQCIAGPTICATLLPWLLLHNACGMPSVHYLAHAFPVSVVNYHASFGYHAYTFAFEHCEGLCINHVQATLMLDTQQFSHGAYCCFVNMGSLGRQQACAQQHSGVPQTGVLCSTSVCKAPVQCPTQAQWWCMLTRHWVHIGCLHCGEHGLTYEFPCLLCLNVFALSQCDGHYPS